MPKERLLEFLKSQQAMVIASMDSEPWVTNIFYGVDDSFKIYFVSDENAKHSQQILKNPSIAFSVVWFNKSNHEDRKGVQGKGKCRKANKEETFKKDFRIIIGAGS